MSLPPQKMLRYEVVNTVAKLRRLRDKMLTIQEFAFDTETNTFEVAGDWEGFICVCITISWGYSNNYYIPMNHRFDKEQVSQNDVRDILGPIFAREDVLISGHNYKFDKHVLKRIGIEIKTKKIFDSMVACHLIDEGVEKGLKACSAREFNAKQEKFKDTVDLVLKEDKKAVGLKANNKATYDLTRIDIVKNYALEDSFYTWLLYVVYSPIINESKTLKKVFYKYYMPFLDLLFTMEEQGITIDQEAINRMSVDMKKDLDELLYSIYEIAGIEFKPTSGQHLYELLFGFRRAPKENKKGVLVEQKANENILRMSYGFKPIGLTDGGVPSTDADTLKAISNMKFKDAKRQQGVELCKLLLQYAKLFKLYSGFVEGIKDRLYPDGKIRPTFNLGGARTGRLSVSNPNFQTLPRVGKKDKYIIRSLFVGDKDKNGKQKMIVAADMANLEIRVLGHYSLDKNLLDIFSREDSDVHSKTAITMFDLDCEEKDVKELYPDKRQAAKTINFALAYGAGAHRVLEGLKEEGTDLGDAEHLAEYKCTKGMEVAEIYVRKYFDSYPGVESFISAQKKFAHKHGFVQTILGRTRKTPNINSADYKMRGYEERVSVNSPIQGSASDIVVAAMLKLYEHPRFKELDAQILLQVHDEIVCQCPEENVAELEEVMIECMRYPFGKKVSLNVPLDADAGHGNSYADAKH